MYNNILDLKEKEISKRLFEVYACELGKKKRVVIMIIDLLITFSSDIYIYIYIYIYSHDRVSI